MSDDPGTLQAAGSTSQPRGRRLGRRALLSVAGAAATGFTLSRLPAPTAAHAADGDDLELGAENTASSETILHMAEGSDPIGLHITFDGLSNEFTGHRVGLIGEGLGTVGAGVIGRNISGTGVSGEGNPGVRGESDNGVGVAGSTTAGGNGPFPPSGGRFSTTANDSLGAHALVQAGFGGPVPSGSVALLAEAPAGNLAARFVGATEIAGSVQLTGDVSIAGSVVVEGALTQVIPPAPGGQPVNAFGIQALERWIEDFGEQTVTGKTTRVTLRPAFVAVADVSSYHVFLVGVGGETPTVSSKDASGFTANVQNNGKGPTSFSYRVVARPR